GTDGHNSWAVEDLLSSLAFQPVLNLRASDYSCFYIRTALSSNANLRCLYVLLQINGSQNRGFFLPLLPDQKEHGYTYDLKLLQLSPDDRITGMRIFPRLARLPIPPVQYQIEEV